MIVLNPPILEASEVSTKVLMGLFGNMNQQISDRLDLQQALSGDFTQSKTESSASFSISDDGEWGCDISWPYPGGKQFKDVEVTSSTNNGFLDTLDPEDMQLHLELYDGSWNRVASTPVFTDGTSAVTKTLTSSDQETFFTQYRILIETASTEERLIGQILVHEVGGSEIIVNKIVTDISRSSGVPVMSAFNGSGVDTYANSIRSASSNNADRYHGVIFHTPYRVHKIKFFSSSDQGFYTTVNPEDVQIDLIGRIGEDWTDLGNTEIFTDAPSLIKEIICTDQVSLYEEVRGVISSATAGRKIVSENEIYVFRAA